MEKPVTFKNRNGSTLFGMLYVPEDAASRRVGIIISVNAIKYRLGTFRLHVLLARKLCSLGYTVFTFDPEGIGDSEGAFEYKLLSEHYFDIQTGKYDSDLADAIGYLAGLSLVESLVLLGLCGGAISVLMAGASDPRVKGLVMLNLPVLVEDLARRGREDAAEKITSTKVASALLKNKAHRLVQVDFWLRLLKLQVDISEELRLVRRGVTVLVGSAVKWLSGFSKQRSNSWHSDRPVSENRLFSMHFQRAFSRAMKEKKPLLFVFADLDPWTWIFKSEFEDRVLKPGARFDIPCLVEHVPAANHIFSGTESRHELERIVSNWLIVSGRRGYWLDLRENGIAATPTERLHQ